MSTVVDKIPSQLELLDQPLESQMTLSMGPQHPSTHGVLRLDLKLDGELVLNAIPDIGYLHTGMEKLFELNRKKRETRNAKTGVMLVFAFLVARATERPSAQCR